MKIVNGDILYFWLRDKDRTRVAVVAYTIVETSHEPEHVILKYAVATRNPKDDFSGVIARAVAAGRLANVTRSIMALTFFRYNHRRGIRADILSQKSLPQTARSAARLWFNSWPQIDRRTSNRRKGDRRK